MLLVHESLQLTPELEGSFETVATIFSVAPASMGVVGGVVNETEASTPGLTVTLVVTNCDGAATAFAWIVTTKLDATVEGAV